MEMENRKRWNQTAILKTIILVGFLALFTSCDFDDDDLDTRDVIGTWSVVDSNSRGNIYIEYTFRLNGECDIYVYDPSDHSDHTYYRYYEVSLFNNVITIYDDSYFERITEQYEVIRFSYSRMYLRDTRYNNYSDLVLERKR